jgi:serine/threonine protein kinase
MSDIIGGYEVTTAFTTAGGGQSRWAFARKKGTDYFLKEFLSPKYPVDGAPGSESTKARQRQACAAFEEHHKAITKVLRPLSSSGGNLVVTTDFFRSGPRYYKVTEKVEVTNWAPTDVVKLPLGSRLLLMLTVAHSLNVLHRAELVHGDIKPPNILIKRLGEGRFSTKLIDFDNAVLATKTLPPPDQLVGDMAYYSPELVRYLNDPDPDARLSGAADIFALGLVYAEWLTGKKPSFDPSARYAGVAVARGDKLRTPVKPAPLQNLIERMLSDQPSERPPADEVHSTIRGIRSAEGSDVGVPPATDPVAGEPVGAPGLRGSLLRKGSAEAEPVANSASSLLRGSLTRRAERK